LEGEETGCSWQLLMTDFDKILWGFIFSTIGIAFGWLLNQAGQWFRTRQEDKKSLKQVIYNLLETYHCFLRCDFDAITKMITDKVFEKIPKEQQTPQTHAEMNKLYSNFVINHLKPEILDQLDNIKESYQSSIKSLASIDPLTAFYLSGKTTILDRLEIIEDWYEEIKNESPLEANEIEEGTKKAMEIIRPDILASELKDLEDDILKLACRVNPVMWWRIKRAIGRMKKSVSTEMHNKIDDLFNKIVM